MIGQAKKCLVTSSSLFIHVFDAFQELKSILLFCNKRKLNLTISRLTSGKIYEKHVIRQKLS